MTIEQITSLVNAGFTKEEILALQNSEPVISSVPAPEPKEPEPDPEPKKEPEPEPKKEADPEPKHEIKLEDVIKSNQEVMENITKLTAAIQANAIRTAIQPQQVDNYTPEDALAEIIAPPPVERKV